jgi:signal transduction histidine kinase
VHALKRAGFEVMEASTGKEALELSNYLPAVMVLDVKLPDILGYEVCRRIKANASTNQILVLQLSAAFLSDESKIHALESGADSFLTQPVEPNVLIATVRSLVRLHNAELNNRRLGEQWQSTFDGLAEGVALVDPSGMIQRSNRALTKILNRPYADIEGFSLAVMMEQGFGFRIDKGDEFSSREVQMGTRYFRLKMSPVVRNELHNGSIFIVAETTEQKRAEAAFLINERLAATGRISNTIAHEINNPLEAITNLLYLLNLSLNNPETAAGLLHSAQEQLSRVSRISRQILSFNRESAVPVTAHLFQLMDDVLALNNRAIVAKELRIERDWDESVTVSGFPAQLRQVFSNLLRNAVDASKAGGRIRIRISSRRRWGNLESPIAKVLFSDTGVGILPENMDRIFEPFFTTKELKGSGIGLWLSNSIVQEHRGNIRVRSNSCASRSGTCVAVILPSQYETTPNRED